MTNETTNEDKILILADLWTNYRTDPNFEDFIKYNDLGLPLAYAIENEIVDFHIEAMGFISETFNLLLTGLGLVDTGFTSLTEMFEATEQ